MSNKKLFKTVSKHAYYQNYNQYTPAFIAKYETMESFKLGRASLYKTLVFKFAGQHNNLEEDHNMTYKMHPMIVNVMYRTGWYLLACIIIWNMFLLGEPYRVFNTSYWDYLTKPSNDFDVPTRYEALYLTDRVQKF